jgi:hypothetical protein
MDEQLGKHCEDRLRNKPWIVWPLELIRHAEEFRSRNGDFDRRIALIAFDNAIEASITTYFDLQPPQRDGQELRREDLAQWKRSFNSKIEFVQWLCDNRGQQMEHSYASIIYYHSLRNELYHGGNGMVPGTSHLASLADVSKWIFSLLFGEDANALLQVPPTQAEAKLPAAAISPPTDFLGALQEVQRRLVQLIEATSGTADVNAGISTLVRALSLRGVDPAITVSDAARFDKATSRLLREDMSEDGEASLAGLSKQLKRISVDLGSKLKAHQMRTADRAIKAVCEAIQGDGDAGIVMQAAGTGLTAALAAFVVMCREHEQLSATRIVILTGRIVLRAQISHVLNQFLTEIDNESVIQTWSSPELIDTLEDRACRSPIVATTTQLRGTYSYGRSCIVVLADPETHTIAVARISEYFPRGTLITFTSSAPTSGPSSHKIVSVYSAKEALVDGFLADVVVERHLSPAIGASLFAEDAGNEDIISAARNAASALLNDMQVRGKTQGLQTILITPSKLAAKIAAKWIAEEAARRSSSYTIVADGENYADALTSADPAIALVAERGMTGLDLPSVSLCYVTTPLSGFAVERIVSLLSRSRDPSRVAKVVDLSGANDWDMALPK